MGRILCLCGNIFSDTTDFIPYKAWLLADQDLEDAFDEKRPSEGRGSDQETIYGKFLLCYARSMYQCGDCHRLFLSRGKDDRRLVIFRPENPENSEDLLCSIEGEKWKGFLRGYWEGTKGYLYWQVGVDDEGSQLNIKTWEEMKEKYHEVFQRLSASHLLRGASLSNQTELVHIWPPRNEN